MPHGPKGDCDRCGVTYRLSQLRKEWTGFMVCHGPGTNDCWEPRHPQDFVRGVPDRQGVRPNMRPEPSPSYTVTAPTYVRSKIEQLVGMSGTSQTMTITAPTAGNLLLLYVAPEKTSGAFFTPTDNGSGTWAAVGTGHTAGTGVSGQLYSKIASGTETSVTATWTTSTNSLLACVEILNGALVDQYGISVSQVSSSARTSGMILAPRDVVGLPQLGVAFAHTDSASSTDTATAHGWSNGFSEVDQVGMGDTNYTSSSRPSCSIGTKAISSTETPYTEFTWTGDGTDECMGVLVTIRPEF